MKIRILLIIVNLISLPVIAKDISVDVFYQTPLGPDIGVLLQNNSKDDTNFLISFIPQNCNKFGLSKLHKIRNSSTIDNSGVIQSGNFRTSYYSLGALNYSAPCKVKVTIETIDKTDKPQIYETVINVSHEKIQDFRGRYGNLKNLKLSNNFIRMNKTHFQYSILVENKDDEEVYLVELSSVTVNCSKGNLVYLSTGNFPDGISNGRGVIEANSWRAYKFIFKSNDPTFSCSIITELSDIIHQNEIYYEGKANNTLSE